MQRDPILQQPGATRALWFHIGDEELVVRSGQGGIGRAEQRLDLGASRIARDFFSHDLPTAREIEKAIDVVEDEIMRLGPRLDAGIPLRSRSEVLQPWAAASGPTITLEIVERWLERLVLAAHGRAHDMDGLPPGREAAAVLLVLREFMHHRGHPSISAIEPRQALVDGSGAV